MKRISRIRFLPTIIVLIFTINSGWSQIDSPDFENDEDAFVFFDLTEELDKQLLPLDSLVAQANASHPTVMLNIELEQSAQERVALATKTWTNMLSAFANYGYGNQSLIATGTIESDMLNVANGYRVGVNLAIPLSEFATRKNRINLAKHELRASQFKTEEMSLVIANQVSEEYYNLLLSQRLMLIRQNMKENSMNNLKIMELEYKAGNIDLQNYTRMMEIETLSRVEFERARRDLLLSYTRLEILLGVPLVTFHVSNRR